MSTKADCGSKVSAAEVLAVIPARGGSKSIPRKNLALLAGRPLIGWAIGVALGCAEVSRVILSTDDIEIAQVGRSLGAEVPFLRPAELAQDNTPGIAPILHAAHWLEQEERYCPGWILCLQPTSPLRTVDDVEAAIELARVKDADAVVSVMPADHHPYWMKQVDAEGLLADWHAPERPLDRRQDLPPLYALNGAIYLARRDLLLEKESWYAGKTCAYVMPPERSLDIDTPWDLHLADLILQDRQQRETG